MKNSLPLIFFFSVCCFLLCGCEQIDNIDYTPRISPEDFLQNQHWIKVQLAGYSFIWSQPGSTIIVYFVGLFTMYVGCRFIRDGKQQSKIWWGIGLLLTGLGALFAGTSYQALGYEIKCAGRAFCTFTSWWEIVYMLLSVPGLNAFLVATAYTNLNGHFRKALMAFAVIHTLVYVAVMMYGVWFSVKFAVSFECMVMISLPGIIFLLLLHSIGYARRHDEMNLILRNSWLIASAVVIVYFLYLISGVTGWLWQQGIWFTENDVLHAGMIYWAYYILKKTRYVLADSAHSSEMIPG